MRDPPLGTDRETKEGPGRPANPRLFKHEIESTLSLSNHNCTLLDDGELCVTRPLSLL